MYLYQDEDGYSPPTWTCASVTPVALVVVTVAAVRMSGSMPEMLLAPCSAPMYEI